MVHLSFNFTLFKSLFREAFRGKSLMRIFMNHSLLGITLADNILDLGSKSSAASYHRFLRYRDPHKITYTDLYVSGPDIVNVDLEKPFPLQNNFYDHITCFNVLEHIYHHELLIKESYRVLKTGGDFIALAPLLVNYHADPHDYFRYTHETLEKLAADAGFKVEKMMFLGFGPMAAAASMSWFALPKFFRPFYGFFMILLDLIILRLKKSQKLMYPLGYLFIFKKV